MKTTSIISIDLMTPIWLAFILFVGISGKVDWWIITLVLLLKIKIPISRRLK